MTNSPVAQITVIFPMTDLRGEAVEHLRTWTHQQTLARERYRMVVAFEGTDRSQAGEIASLLSAQDELVPVPNGNSPSALVNAGVAHAATPWLLITEGHFLAPPACLATVVQWLDANPQAAVGNLDQNHP